MTMRTMFLVFLTAVCIWPARGQEQPKPGQSKDVTAKPTAKEMFLNPRQMPYGVQDETPPSTKPKPVAQTNPKPKPKVVPAAPKGSSQPGQPTTPVVYSDTPLGLRYTLLRKIGDQTTDVSADTEFHSKDRIQLGLEVNDSGYLYIIQQGTSGNWSTLFPSLEIENGDNRVERGHVYTVPPKHVFTFSGTPGVERMFVIFSRQPVQEIDSLIYSLKGARQTPAAEPGQERTAPETLSASARPIDDKQIKAMRNVYSRDLIIEKGDAGQGDQQQDKSVYVVNPKGSVDSRVVADIPLTHK